MFLEAEWLGCRAEAVLVLLDAAKLLRKVSEPVIVPPAMNGNFIFPISLFKIDVVRL